jgi:hypothetical protein
MREELRLTLSSLLDVMHQLRIRGGSFRETLYSATDRNHRLWLVRPSISESLVPAAGVLEVRFLGGTEDSDRHRAVGGVWSGRRVVLGVGVDRLNSMLCAELHEADHSVHPLDVLVVGGGFHNAVGEEADKSAEDYGIWSPTRRALGEHGWQMVQQQRVTIIGAGRTGSQLAESLHRMGKVDVTMIDSDRVESHNVGESSLLNRDDIGRYKAQAIAGQLWKTSPGTGRIDCVLSALNSLPSLAAVSGSTLLISAVDNPAARLLATILASLFLVPLLDLGTGIFHGESLAPAGRAEGRTMGADIRLCLPDRCLLCTGGLPGVEQAATDLLDSGLSERAAEQQRPWFEQRSGSLRSLNGCAVSLAIRMVEDWLANRLPQRLNRLLQLRFEEDGSPVLTKLDYGHIRSSDCPICGIAGQGDGGLPYVAGVLRQVRDRTRQDG